MSIKRHLWIIFGSQTGTAQDVAEYLERGARRRLFSTYICSGEDILIEDFIEATLVIFVCSTTGQGEMPDNIKPLWRFLLRKDLPEDFLESMEFAVFGIGSTLYPKYNWSSKKLYRRLLQLGAQSIHERGEVDEQHEQGIDGVLIPWSQELWTILLEKYPIPKGYSIYPETSLLSSSFFVNLNKTKVSSTTYSIHRANVIKVTVSQNLRITSQDHWQDVRHMILDIHDDSVTYYPGDNIILYPSNPSKEVEIFLKCMNWLEIADVPLKISSKRIYKNHLIPSEATLRFLFTNILDILSVPRRSFFEFLAHFTDNKEFIDKFHYFCSTEGQEDLYDYVNRPRRTILEVIQDFSPLNIPLDYIFDVFPIISGRKFSIASSLKANPGQIHLCVAIVKYKTILRSFRYGLCTRWISFLSEGIEIEIGFSSGTLKKPKLPSIPIVMIGPGTGVSPLRSLIQERIFDRCKNNILFFGCRSQYKDFLFKDEWMEYCKNNDLILFTAFSRDQSEKRYVQHVMEENSGILYDYLYNKLGILYLSGSSRFMPEAVKQSFLNILMKEGNLSDEQSRAWLSTMEKEGRYLQETWS
ncbi:hypothetical protein T552_03132 [Pneumocystis carinii B80]|uniref:NADPH-dependent diflavin oxidoreductase 1 n=1 Tax=Pneumocystis carinii (strain B80) TaxID=1408658 RepID=A0A0W4ZC20_PNEC8|nr:hypothetical protein T552_03132 [Pneumocystis carinii B80]KTW25859.1 hypothetical protein T552_03132 [Pneumocystis carinii B80]